MGDVSRRTYYDRQLRVPGWGPQGQDRLAQATVLVVGAGGLGCPALESLARAGVGRLVVVDPDRVALSDLPRQTLYRPGDTGRLKVEAAAEALRAINPFIDIVPLALRFSPASARSLVEAADLVVEGTDNFTTKFLVHDSCRAAGVPLVAGAVHQWEAQLSAWAFGRGQTGCWRCLYPQAPADGCVGVCAETGVAGALTGSAGHLMALKAVRLLLGLDPVGRPSTWLLDAAEGTTRTLRWSPDPACSCASAAGDWAFLQAGNLSAPRDLPWEDLALGPADVVVDLREESERSPRDQVPFTRAGCQTWHVPYSAWPADLPRPEAPGRLVLICAHGVRSRAVLATLDPAVAAVSLAGGLAALDPRLFDGGPVPS